MSLKSIVALAAIVASAGSVGALGTHVDSVGEDGAHNTYIVQAGSAEAAVAAVEHVGGDVVRSLAVIRAVGADLTDAELDALRSNNRITVYANRGVESSGRRSRDRDDDDDDNGDQDQSADGGSYINALIEADRLHDQGIDGYGVTVAVIDSGLWKKTGTQDNAYGEFRILAQYDVIRDREEDLHSGNDYEIDIDDASGHGTHVTSVMANSDETFARGVAPSVDLVAVRALDGNGQGTYLDVISAVDWVVSHQHDYNIRVLNLSLSAPPRSHYWDDPLNQAVMAAWQQGIVVVASAGNTGPEPMTIGVPGNVPYVITVGAVSNAYTTGDKGDDFLASFSSAGPTHEGFVKPEVVAPGGHVLGWMPPHGSIPQAHPEFMHVGQEYFTMSGTSQSAGVVSGVVALMLQNDPNLSPDDVKCRIMKSARPAVSDEGNAPRLAYSVFQQGAGMTNAYDAVNSTETGCANVGLDINADLAGTKHFGGRANQDESGSFYLMQDDNQGSGAEHVWDGYLMPGGYMWTDGFVWTDSYLWTDAFLWTDGRIGSNGFLWTDGFIWTDGYMWTDSFLWTDGYLWSDSLTESMSINSWVPQE